MGGVYQAIRQMPSLQEDEVLQQGMPEERMGVPQTLVCSSNTIDLSRHHQQMERDLQQVIAGGTKIFDAKHPAKRFFFNTIMNTFIPFTTTHTTLASASPLLFFYTKKTNHTYTQYRDSHQPSRLLLFALRLLLCVWGPYPCLALVRSRMTTIITYPSSTYCITGVFPFCVGHSFRSITNDQPASLWSFLFFVGRETDGYHVCLDSLGLSQYDKFLGGFLVLS